MQRRNKRSMESDETKSIPYSWYLCALYSQQAMAYTCSIKLFLQEESNNYDGTELTNRVATMYNAMKLS